MTLFKQMALVVSFIIIIMLSGVMYINYESAKKDMITSLYETTVNNISTLTNKLGDAGQDYVLLTTIIDSEFDSGYYKLIAFTSNDGLFSYKQEDKESAEGVPAWFIEYTHIDIESITADVSSGWSISGELEITGDTAIVYKALYKMFIKLLYLFIIFVVISLLLLSIMLHFVLKPLKLVQKQAEAILNNKFVIQENEPYTTEFREVVKGMNAMVRKVEDIFSKANEAAQRNRELLYNDPVTKLFNRRYLMLKLPDLIKLENKTEGGTILFIALSSVELISKAIGNRDTDEILMKVGERLKVISKKFEDSVIARVNSTEFMLILPDCEAHEASEIANKINTKFDKTVQEYKLDSDSIFINIGLYRYKPSVSIADLLTRADSALSNAKADETANTYLYEEKDDENAMGKEQWRNIIEESISHNHFSLRFYPTLNVKSKNIEHKVMTFTIEDNSDKRYFYGDFIAPAINLGLVSKMYIVALKKLITMQHKELNGTLCSIRLSNEFIKDAGAYSELSSLFRKHAKTLKFKLFFEVSDSFAINNTQKVKSFIELFSQYGFGFGINSFTGESNDYAYLKELNPAFIKADTPFLLDQSQDSMSALQVITDSLGVDIVASAVNTSQELEKLTVLHINIVQGPITDKI